MQHTTRATGNGDGACAASGRPLAAGTLGATPTPATGAPAALTAAALDGGDGGAEGLAPAAGFLSATPAAVLQGGSVGGLSALVLGQDGPAAALLVVSRTGPVAGLRPALAAGLGLAVPAAGGLAGREAPAGRRAAAGGGGVAERRMPRLCSLPGTSRAERRRALS
ncbi:circumsporozoite protein-like [Schistocerca piceifrons]|uniref:circumsporozoite protein-like n=1 Tax=Schistocerca piceifrons TaxID=274613 RepID=UPI001F5F80C6|nr:circumsporozoite protein-like [Schistocerca piceifrons]